MSVLHVTPPADTIFGCEVRSYQLRVEHEDVSAFNDATVVGLLRRATIEVALYAAGDNHPIVGELFALQTPDGVARTFRATAYTIAAAAGALTMYTLNGEEVAAVATSATHVTVLKSRALPARKSTRSTAALPKRAFALGGVPKTAP